MPNSLIALVLIESTPISCRHRCVSASRDSLIEWAEGQYLHRSMTPLREPSGRVTLDERVGSVLTIEEVEFV